MTIDLYMMEPSAPCRAVLMTAKLIGLDINKKCINVLKKEQLTPEFLKINPQHCIPTIDDNGFILWESRAIMTYLINKYASDSVLYPEDPKRRASIDRLLYFDIGTLYTCLSNSVHSRVFKGESKDPHKDAALKDSIHSLEKILEKTNSYVGGDQITLADISIVATIGMANIFAEELDLDFSLYPHIQAWENRVKDRLPFYKEVNEFGEGELKSIIEMKKKEARNQ